MSRTPKTPFIETSLDAFLAQCARMTREHGWTSVKDAVTRGIKPSAELAFRATLDGVETTPDDQLTGQKALDLFLSRANSSRASKFDHDTAELIAEARDRVNSRNYRQVGAIMSFYLRVVSQADLVASAPPSFYLGAVGERLVFTAEVSHVTYFAGRFSTWIVNMVTAQGARLSWFTSRPLEVGKTYTLRGTVKAHREYQGHPQTVVTRCVEVMGEDVVAA